MQTTFFRLTSACAGVAMVVVAIYACGGSTSPAPGTGGGDGSTGDGSSGSSGSSGGLSTTCPASAPANGVACGANNLECEYGSDPALACNVVATCGEGVWHVSTPAGSPTCPTTNASACAATKDALPPGATCSSANTTCTYASGTCVCHMACGSQVPIGRPCDAGTPLTWDCGGASTSCPADRPHLGAACTMEALDCNYGQEPCQSTSFVCENGTWHSKMNQCPVSTARMKKEIHYLSDAELKDLSEQTDSLRLTTYRYTEGDPQQHLGFIIEDAPASPAVIQGRDRIDLYGYTSMTVATLQVQQKEIAALRAEVESLRREIATQRARQDLPRSP